MLIQQKTPLFKIRLLNVNKINKLIFRFKVFKILRVEFNFFTKSILTPHKS